MVIPHLRVNYLTRNKWLGNNLEDREYTQRGQHAGCWMFVCFVISDHNTALLVSCPGEDLCRCESILKKGFIWYDLLEPYDSSEWEIYVRFDEKIDAISSLSSCNDGTVFYFLSRDSVEEQLALHKGIEWSKATLGRCTADLYFKDQPIFFCNPASSLDRAVRKNNKRYHSVRSISMPWWSL